MRLLIVEDDDTLRETLLHRLTREGYGADACGDGIEGLALALSAPYDGMVLDIMLPGMDGLSLLTALRARGYGGRRAVAHRPGRRGGQGSRPGRGRG